VGTEKGGISGGGEHGWVVKVRRVRGNGGGGQMLYGVGKVLCEENFIEFRREMDILKPACILPENKLAEKVSFTIWLLHFLSC
jgi:hypothetical protein